MATAVLRFDQPVDSTPEHHVGKDLADGFLSYWHNGQRAVQEVRKGLLQIVVDIPFGKLKQLVRIRAVGPTRIPVRAKSSPAVVSPRRLVESIPRPEVEGLKFQRPDGKIENHAAQSRRVKHWLCFPSLKTETVPACYDPRVDREDCEDPCAAPAC